MATNAPLILSSGICGITRMLPYDPEGGLTLEDWRPTGLYEMTLPPDAVLALLRALPGGILREALGTADVAPSVLHWQASPDRAVCGSDAPGLGRTPAPQHVTCPACLAAWHQQCRQTAHTALAVRREG